MNQEKIFFDYKKILSHSESFYIAMPKKIGFRFDEIIIRESNEVREAGGALIDIELPSQSFLVTNKGISPKIITKINSGAVVEYGGEKLVESSLRGRRFGFSSLSLDRGEQAIIKVSIPKTVLNPFVEVLVIGYKEGEF